MKLFYSPGVCSLASHIVLRRSQLPFELVKANIRTGKMEDGSDYNKINPKGYVPALLLDDGELLTEGAVILQYLSDLAPQHQLFPPAGTRERYRAQAMLNFIATEIHKGYSPLFNPAMPEAAKTIIRTNLGKRFDLLSETLARQNFLLGEQFTAPDAYLFTTLRWSEGCAVPLQNWPTLIAYRERVAALPFVQGALQVEGLAK
ncbi:MAG: glutathione transferase GstA [Gammaproteobacteria bacterium]|nr:glutathione transferase GstA [Gammaproteobacteria bacterium]